MRTLLKSNPSATLITAVCVLIAMAGLGLAARSGMGNKQRLHQLEQFILRSNLLRHSIPPPTRDTLAALDSYQQDIEARTGAIRAELFPASNPIPRFEGNAESFYFAVMETIESLRSLTREHDVLLNHADEAFGFALMQRSGQGPMDAQLQAYQERRVLLQLLVETLIASRPAEITEVEMEPAGIASTAQIQAVEKDARDDLFIINPGRSLRGLGKVKTIGFRLQFRARTNTLRDWVNRLNQSGYPIVLRSMEVAPPEQNPLNDSHLKRKSPSAATEHPFSFLQTRSGSDTRVVDTAGAPVPLVKDNLSSFTIVLEYYQPETWSMADSVTP